MAKWIDFKTLREQLDMHELLDHYDVEFKVKGSQAQAYCPLPTHEGQKRSVSFSANLERNIWQCFGCGAKGNALDFAVRMEGYNPHDSKELREAAEILQEKFGDEKTQSRSHQPAQKKKSSPKKRKKQRVKKRKRKSESRTNPKESDTSSPAEPNGSSNAEPLVNAPLDFELKGLDPNHPYLRERGLTQETIEHFGLGYCDRGLMKGRIAIPLRNLKGELIGYAGRIVDDDLIDDENPKYLFPSRRRERNGIVYEFRKSEFIYNAHAIEAPVDELILVEGFFACFWLWQNGVRNVGALMGCSCSSTQAKIIHRLLKPTGLVTVRPDPDDAGRRCTTSVINHLAPHRYMSCATIALDVQPAAHSSLGNIEHDDA